MTFKEMEQIAYDLLLSDDFVGIYHAAESEKYFIFDGGDPDMDWYGIRSVIVDKKTGEATWYDPTLLDIINKNVQIDDEFLFKK